jgi:hypothetical protein
MAAAAEALLELDTVLVEVRVEGAVVEAVAGVELARRLLLGIVLVILLAEASGKVLCMAGSLVVFHNFLLGTGSCCLCRLGSLAACLFVLLGSCSLDHCFPRGRLGSPAIRLLYLVGNSSLRLGRGILVCLSR